MAQILITNSRPQFATVRYKVMDKAEKVETPTGRVTLCPVTDLMVQSRIPHTPGSPPAPPASWPLRSARRPPDGSTKLEMKANTDLVQIRPAFGGNIMAQILIT